MTTLSASKRRSLDERFSLIAGLPSFISATERYKHTLRDVRQGGVIRFGGKVWLVRELNTCTDKEDGYLTTELVLLCFDTGETTTIEWDFDDELEVSQNIRKLSFRDLKDEEGERIDDDDLEQIVDDEDSVFLNGQEFEFEEDCDVIFRRVGSSEEPCEVWTLDFEANDGAQGITIEEWQGNGGESYEVWLWKAVEPDAIEVLLTGGD